MDRANWSDLLEQAVTEPGLLADAYQKFWGYSLGNQMMALGQCLHRGIAPGPIATFKRWLEVGRCVKKGEKAIWLTMPVTARSKNEDDDEGTFVLFVVKPRWFVLDQTDGDPFVWPVIPEWDAHQAIDGLGITLSPTFDDMNGNKQGYSIPKRKLIAISPVAANPAKTILHELAHCLLHDSDEAMLTINRPDAEVEAEAVALLCSDALGLPGANESRGYIQEWRGNHERIGERMAARIFSAADRILKAGRETVPDSLAEAS